MDNKDLKFLKKHYGEKFAKLCRELFPTLLEEEGLLTKIITEHFDNVPSLYEDILPKKYDFQAFVENFLPKNEDDRIGSNKTPYELMELAGYDLFECTTEEEIQSFKKYYAPGEELCTFWGERLKSCRVWFAVKKNVDEIKRENFTTPEREDEYGTSVLSIQFTKTANSTLSIKNRYNHAVKNPDATFGNDLDRIIPGLTYSFTTNYGIVLKNEIFEHFYLSDYIYSEDLKFYKSNCRQTISSTCCANNVIIDYYGNVITLDKDKFILMDNYVLDLQNKKLTVYDALSVKSFDGFTESIGEIKNITIKKDENKNKIVVITPTIGEDVIITLNPNNSIIGLYHPNVTEVSSNFLSRNVYLETLNLPNVIEIGSNFMRYNQSLSNLILPNLRTIGDGFLFSNKALTSLNLPSLQTIGSGILFTNNAISSVNLPQLVSMGANCNFNNIQELTLPLLENVGDNFLSFNTTLKKVYLPKLEVIYNNFLTVNKCITELVLPNVKNIGDNFLKWNNSLTNLVLPNVKYIGDNFLKWNKSLTNLELPNVTKIGDYFLSCNDSLYYFNYL